MVEVGAAAHVAEDQAEEQREYDHQEEPADGAEAQFHGDQRDPGMSPSGMISFSPEAARAFPSPARAGTSAQPEIGPDHAAPFHADTQEHAGLDELLYQMSTCPPAEFASLASTYRMTRAGDAVTGAPGGSTRGRRGSTGATAPSHYTGRQIASVRHRRSQASPRRRPSELV
ncbi:hypothetical protein PIB30_048436, partial [Stylosanthes scabra]|nr:hypothetical protein [Stylosanthes scabra]